MATITTTTSLSFDAAASLTVGVDKNFEGSIAFTSAAENVQPSFTVTKPQSQVYGPFGVAMTVVITVGNGSLDYTINGGMGGFSYDTDGNITGFVSGDGNYGPLVASVDPSASTGIAQQIQAIHDAMPNTGGAIYIPEKSTKYQWTAQVTLLKPVCIFSLTHKGGSISNAGSNPAAVNIEVASGIKAIYCGQTTPALFCGVTVRNLTFTSADGSGWAIYNNNMSNCTYEDVSITGFTTGVGIEFIGNAGQYSRLNRVYIHGTLTGVKITDYNGVVIDNCFIDPANNNATPMASSIGINITNASADTCFINNTQIQGCDVCIDTTGAKGLISNCRFEIFNTGIVLRGDRQTVGVGNSFNNFIYGASSPNRGVSVESGATFAQINPCQHGSLTPELVSDSGTNTMRRDGVLLGRVFDLVSATTSFILSDVPHSAANSVFYSRYVYFHSGDTAIAADGSNYWTINMYRATSGGSNQGLNASINSISGWALTSKNAIGTSTNNNALNAGEQIRVTFTKTGTPSNLTNCSLQTVLVPY